MSMPTGPDDPSVQVDETIAATAVQARADGVTLVEGASFCLSDDDGAITPDGHLGLYVSDTRVISRWQLTLDGDQPEVLAIIPEQSFSCRLVGRMRRHGAPDGEVVVERHRYVSEGMREDLTLINYGRQPVEVEVVLQVDADFADIFEIRGMPARERTVDLRTESDALDFRLQNSGGRGLRVTTDSGMAAERTIRWQASVPAQGSWVTTIQVLPIVDDHETSPAFPTDRPIEASTPMQRTQRWNEAAPRTAVDHPGLAAALAISRRDLGALRIADPDHRDDVAVAAGAPWFMTLFGRDSLLTSSMVLPYFPDLALGTLRSLGRLQGSTDNPQTEEQPGKILHEVRRGADPSLALGGASVYYGSIDSTPLFVRLVGDALLLGVAPDAIKDLMPAVDRAMTWIDEYGDRDGDGFVEYVQTSDHGLLHQGWKDSSDPISFADGRLAEPPIALAEVQGYVYAAYLARADLAEAFGEDGQPWRDRAAALQERFHQRFWLRELGFYAVALDAGKKPVDTATSNIGHCLWSGIVPEEFAGQVVQRLLSPDLFTGFGIRTLARSAGRYNPASYHNGSVWPHDSALVAAGIARYGFRAEAMTVLDGLLDAAEVFGGRLPELFCGFGRDEMPVPVAYPTSCSPQAWAAAVPFAMLTIRTGSDEA
jgi:glycogen debranching enzyme